MQWYGFFEQYCLLHNYLLILVSWIISQRFLNRLVAEPCIITTRTMSKYKVMKNERKIDVVIVILREVIVAIWTKQFSCFLEEFVLEDLILWEVRWLGEGDKPLHWTLTSCWSFWTRHWICLMMIYSIIMFITQMANYTLCQVISSNGVEHLKWNALL